MKQDTVAPVRASVTVNAPQDRAFAVFTERIGDWWPSATHSIEEDNVATVVMECRKGGSIYERHKDGSQPGWGTIREWSPPHRVVFSWNPSYENRPETEVEVSFTVVSERETRVDLEHRAWELLGDRAQELREGYVPGWSFVLNAFVEGISTAD